MRSMKSVPGRSLLVGSALACALCLGVVSPTAAATTAPLVSTQIGGDRGGLVRNWEPDEKGGELYLDRVVDGLDGRAVVIVVTPGTDDTGLYPRVGGMVGDHDAMIIDYPEAFAPVASGRSGDLLPFLAPTYEQSKSVAIGKNLAVMELISALGLGEEGPRVVYTGYSQGADALGDAADLGRETLLEQDAVVVLISDPRSPWGIKAWAGEQPQLTPVLDVLGIENNGVRDPAATDGVAMTSVVVAGDPVAHWQWQPDRPLASLLVNGAGFLTVHFGLGPQNYGDLDRLDRSATYDSVDGTTEYQIYDARHPVALLGGALAEAVGVEVSEEQLDAWDAEADRFYELSVPGPDNAAVPLKAAAQPAGEVEPVVSDPAMFDPAAPDIVEAGRAAGPQIQDWLDRLLGKG